MGQNQSAFTFIGEKCCGKCAEILVEKGCKELADLLDISKEDLEKFGIEEIHLRKILRSIQKLNEEPGFSSIRPKDFMSGIQKAWPYGSDYAFARLKGGDYLAFDFKEVDSGESLHKKIKLLFELNENVDLNIKCCLGEKTFLITKSYEKNNIWLIFEDFTWDHIFLVERSEMTSTSVPSAQPTLTTYQSTNYPGLPKELTGSQSFDVMLSYQWDNQAKIKCIKDFLDKHFTVWMDLTEMNGNADRRMSEGISRSKIILPCFSSTYEESYNCQKEINLAEVLHKPITPVRMEKSPFSPWSLAFAPKEIYIDLHGIEPDQTQWTEKMTALCKEIRRKIEIDKKHNDVLTITDPLAKWLKPVDFSRDVSSYQKTYVEGTRTWLVQKVHQAISNNKVRTIWLNGVTGVGKSVMSWLLSTKLPPGCILGSYFFCHHNSKKNNNTKSVILTTAYQLSLPSELSAFRDHLFELLKIDEENVTNLKKSIFELPSSVLFVKLIVDGLKKVKSSIKDVVIIIDALDEFGSPGEHERKELLSVIRNYSKTLPEFVSLFVSGRPEVDIWESLFKLRPLLELTPSDKENLTDLKLFLKNRLNIHYHNSSEESLNNAIETLAQKAGGVFLWAKLACDYINEVNPKNVDKITDIINTLNSGMDAILMTVLRESYKSNELIDDFQLIVGTVCVLQESLTIEALASLLSIDSNRVANIVLCNRHIIAVNLKKLVVVVHKSVTDFLTSSTRCDDKRFYIDEQQATIRLANSCLAVLNKDLHFNICELDLKILNTSITEIEDQLSKIPSHLVYAAKFWISHALQCSEQDLTEDVLYTFASNHLLHWVEVLSVCNSLSIVQTLLPHLIPKIHEPHTVNLLKDIKRLVVEFFKPISQSAIHVYCSALVLLPDDTRLFKIYYPNFKDLKLPKVITGKDQDWSPCLSTFEGHTGQVNSIAWWISMDGKASLIVSASDDNSVRLWDACTSILIHQFGLANIVESIAFSKDGTKLVLGSSDETVQIWNIET
ncbi:POC1 centriolar protein A, partial [Nowakowskiella sp. JEL0078]